MWFGRLIGGLIGFFSGGFLGLVLGIIVGNYFDKALTAQASKLSPEERANIEETFFYTTFLLMGKLAKADGHVSEAEISHTEQLMSRMALRTEHRRRAIDIFKDGANTEFNLDQKLAEFRQVCARHPALSKQLLSYLLSLSLADGSLSKEEEALLRVMSSGLGVSVQMFDQLLRMMRAQAHFGHQQGGASSNPTPSKSELNLAYEALGLEADKAAKLSDSELKKVYRKLMSENHPDKLTGQGVPEDMIKLATERSQDIQAAYELVTKYRSF